MRDLPLACSLEGAQLRERGERWSALASRALTARDRVEGGVRLTFSASDGVVEELRELIRLEGDCCAFLDLRIEDGDGEVALTIAGPAGADAVVDAFLELPARA